MEAGRGGGGDQPALAPGEASQNLPENNGHGAARQSRFLFAREALSALTSGSRAAAGRSEGVNPGVGIEESEKLGSGAPLYERVLFGACTDATTGLKAQLGLSKALADAADGRRGVGVSSIDRREDRQGSESSFQGLYREFSEGGQADGQMGSASSGSAESSSWLGQSGDGRGGNGVLGSGLSSTSEVRSLTFPVLSSGETSDGSSRSVVGPGENKGFSSSGSGNGSVLPPLFAPPGFSAPTTSENQSSQPTQLPVGSGRNIRSPPGFTKTAAGTYSGLVGKQTEIQSRFMGW